LQAKKDEKRKKIDRMTKKNIEERRIFLMNETCCEMMELLDAAFLYRKPIEERILMFASLLYLRKEEALLIKPEEEQYVEDVVLYNEKGNILHYNERVFWVNGNQEFRTVLEETLSKFAEAKKPERFLQIANILSDLKLKKSEFLAMLDYAIHDFGGRNIGVYGQPHELTEIVKSLLDSSVHVVFDPFGGLMDFATSFSTVYYANEISSSIRDIAMFRLALADVLDFCVISHKDSADWTDKNNYDAIVTVPPFGYRMHMSGDEEGVSENSEIVAIKRFEETTNEHGQLITIVPVSFLYGESARTRLLRERLTRKNLLDSIIQLPGGVFSNTGLVTAIVVLKKQRENGQRIKLIDASNCFVKKGRQNVLDVEAVKRLYEESRLEVTTEEILNQNCSWDVQWYWNRLTAVYSEGYTVVRLADVLGPVRATRHYTETIGRFVSIGSMPSDYLEYEKKPEDFPEKESLSNALKITEPVLLVSSIGAPKPTYCKASEESPVYVKSDIFAFSISNKTIHEGYLCMEMAKRLIPTMGALYPRLSRIQILETCVEFPSLDEQRSIVEQKNIYEQARQRAGLDKEKIELLETLLEKRKHEYIEEVRNRKHDMKTPMGQMRSTIKLLDSLANQITGEPAEKLKLYVQRQRRAMDTLSEIVSHIADEEVFATPEPINLSEVLSSCQTATEKYVVAYYPDEAVLKEAGLTKPMVMMGKSDLLRLVQNIIGNAVERGFVDDYPEYSLNISLTIKKGFYIIDFSNNGRPLPEGMTKERYGMKGVKGKGSDGEGKGGYIVKSITEHYGGDYDVYSQQFAGMWFTHVIVKLPIYQDNE
jgi:signal transduction histidine kinase